MSDDRAEADPDAAQTDALVVPEEVLADRIRTVVLGVVGAAPLVGSPGAALFSLVWRPRYEKRVNAFLDQLVDLLRDLDSRIDRIEERLLDDTVVSVAFEAAGSVGRTGDPEKIRYLANAIGNVVVDKTLSARRDFALILTRLVTELTATHIQVLDLLADPEGWLASHDDTHVEPDEEGRYHAHALLKLAFPKLAADNGAMYAVLADLESRGFLNAMGLAGSEIRFDSVAEILRPMATPLAEDLLAFIQDPTSR